MPELFNPKKGIESDTKLESRSKFAREAKTQQFGVIREVTTHKCYP